MKLKMDQSKTSELGNNDPNTIVIQADYCNHLDNVRIEALKEQLHEHLNEKLVSDLKDMVNCFYASTLLNAVLLLRYKAISLLTNLSKSHLEKIMYCLQQHFSGALVWQTDRAVGSR